MHGGGVRAWWQVWFCGLMRPARPHPPPPCTPLIPSPSATHRTAHESFRFVSLALRCRGAAPDTFLDNVTQALTQHQRLLAQQLQQQQQQQAAAAAAGGGLGGSQQHSLNTAGAGGVSGLALGAADGGAVGAVLGSAADVDASYLKAITDMVSVGTGVCCGERSAVEVLWTLWMLPGLLQRKALLLAPG